jgi:hypothetical protein
MAVIPIQRLDGDDSEGFLLDQTFVSCSDEESANMEFAVMEGIFDAYKEALVNEQ